MNKVSFEVFLGTYNAAPWIAGVINSLEQQTCEPFVVNIIDNSSTDNTVEIIKDLFSKFKMRNNYKLVQNSSNIGAISTFLDRLDLFEQDWIFMVHQDDYYHPGHFETLIEGISKASASTSLVFTAMKRMNENNNEIFPDPTLSQLISKTDRFSNILLTLQIYPINFPTVAMKKSVIKNLQTSRHTTAFNDTELVLRMMCISDIVYIPVETVHYRVHSGNAHIVTDSKSNDFAVIVGLNEFLHSFEFEQLVSDVEPKYFPQLFESIKLALEIRVKEKRMREFACALFAEHAIRMFEYKDNAAIKFLIDALKDLNFNTQVQVLENISNFDFTASPNRFFKSGGTQHFSLERLNKISSNSNYLVRLVNYIPLSARQFSINLISRSPIGMFVRRPFVRVWRKTKKSS